MEKSEIETIYRKYFHDVFLYIRALSENESLAEEITQETFLKAMNNIEKFDGRKDIRAWLFVIAKNTYFRYCRRNKNLCRRRIFRNNAGSHAGYITGSTGSDCAG